MLLALHVGCTYNLGFGHDSEAFLTADRGLAGILIATSVNKPWRSHRNGNTLRHFAVAVSETIKASELSGTFRNGRGTC